MTDSPRAERAASWLRARVAIDTRTLAVFRVLCGLLIVADVLLRSRNFRFFYTEAGVVPQSVATALAPENAFSVYYYTTDTRVIAALFAVQILVALQLVVGYRTTAATVLSFLLVVSLDHHNPLVLSHADYLFRLLLFWAIFLPLGARWSIDAVHAADTPRASVANVASAVILLQVVTVYVVNGLHKTGSSLWWSGEATPLILGLTNTTFLLGPIVRTVPTVLQFGGLVWFAMLLSGWLLPVLQGRKRTLFVLLFVAVHASFAVTVRIGAFPYVSIAGVLLFLQASFWTDAGTLTRRLGISTATSATVRNGLTRTASRIPRPGIDTPHSRRLRTAGLRVTLAAVLVAFAVTFAMSGLQTAAIVDDDTDPHAPIERSAASFGVDQPEWKVFAPTPRTTDRYHVFPARTADGDLVDAYNERPMTFDRPHHELHHQYGTYRERFYMNSVRRTPGLSPAATQYAEYLCDTWADDHGTELTHVNMYVVNEDVTMDTIDDPDARDRSIVLFYRHGCGDRSAELLVPAGGNSTPRST